MKKAYTEPEFELKVFSFEKILEEVGVGASGVVIEDPAQDVFD